MFEEVNCELWELLDFRLPFSESVSLTQYKTISRLNWCHPGWWKYFFIFASHGLLICRHAMFFKYNKRHVVDAETKQKPCCDVGTKQKPYCWCWNKTKDILSSEQNKIHVVDAGKKQKSMLLMPEQIKSHIVEARTKQKQCRNAGTKQNMPCCWCRNQTKAMLLSEQNKINVVDAGTKKIHLVDAGTKQKPCRYAGPTSVLATSWQSWGWQFWVCPLLRIANPNYTQEFWL